MSVVTFRGKTQEDRSRSIFEHYRKDDMESAWRELQQGLNLYALRFPKIDAQAAKEYAELVTVACRILSWETRPELFAELEARVGTELSELAEHADASDGVSVRELLSIRCSMAECLASLRSLQEKYSGAP